MRMRAIARVVKTHGKHGEVVTIPVHGLSSYIKAGMELALVPPELKGSRYFSVAEASGDDAGQLVSFEGVTSISQASALVGKTILAYESDLPGDFALHDAVSLIGREVEDGTHGLLGVIARVMRGSVQDVWQIEGAYGEVLMPVVDEFIEELPGEGRLRVSLPEGMVDGGGEQ